MDDLLWFVQSTILRGYIDYTFLLGCWVYDDTVPGGNI